MSDAVALTVYAVLALALGAGTLLLSWMLGPRRHRREKHSPYECGAPLLQGARERFSVKFYLVALIFILFDIETVFLIPWALAYRQLGTAGLVEMLLFVLVLGIGLYYVYKRGALEWE